MKNIILIVIMAMLYFISGKLSFAVSSTNEIVTIVVFFAEGFALAGVLLFGRKVLAGIFIGQFILAFSGSLDLLPSFLISILNTTEAFMALVLFKRLKLNKSLDSIRDVFGLIALIALVLQPFSATIGNVILLSASVIDMSSFYMSIFSWWFGNSMGQILIVPFVLYLYKYYKQLNKIEYLFIGLLFVAITYVTIVIFKINNMPLLIAIILPSILYVSYIRNLSYSTFATILVSCIAIYSTNIDGTIFVSFNIVDSVININFFILLNILLVLVFGTLLEEKESQNIYRKLILQASGESQIILNEHNDIIDFSNKSNSIFTSIRRGMSLDEFLKEEGKNTVNMYGLKDFLVKDNQDILKNKIIYINKRYLNVVYKSLGNDKSIIILNDITALKNQENNLKVKVDSAIAKNTKQLQLLQQQTKMAQMGEMIGAIAHQWRQPLNVISTSIQNLQYDYEDGFLKDEKYVKEFIDKNKKTIKFMSTTIDDFRNFFRVDKEKSTFDVKKATESVVTMLSSQIYQNNIEVNMSGDKFEFYGLESEYQQVIMNIVNNAKDVLVEKNIKSPKIDIVIKENSISITDNAGGIPQDVLDRIFEPYFTTKEQGSGTGMGLYMSKMIIEDNMGGELKVENRDNGALFTINFNKDK